MSNTAPIKAIETHYNGYRFRSRLEARWAIFFDAMNIRFEYEVKGYDLGSAGWYLPDFWLPDLNCFVEIKSGGLPTTWEQLNEWPVTAKTRGFAFQKDSIVLLFCGDPWYETPVLVFDPDKEKGTTVAVPCRLAQCPVCHHLAIQFRNRPWSDGPIDGMWFDGDPVKFLVFCLSRKGCKLRYAARSYAQAEDLLSAYTAARSARFEHGETPRVQRGRPR